MQGAKPPFRAEEVERVLGLLTPLSESAQIVLDPQLPGDFLTKRYPQMQERLAVIRRMLSSVTSWVDWHWGM